VTQDIDFPAPAGGAPALAKARETGTLGIEIDADRDQAGKLLEMVVEATIKQDDSGPILDVSVEGERYMLHPAEQAGADLYAADTRDRRRAAAEHPLQSLSFQARQQAAQFKLGESVAMRDEAATQKKTEETLEQAGREGPAAAQPAVRAATERFSEPAPAGKPGDAVANAKDKDKESEDVARRLRQENRGLARARVVDSLELIKPLSEEPEREDLLRKRKIAQKDSPPGRVQVLLRVIEDPEMGNRAKRN
jgi:hypothetical protein